MRLLLELQAGDSVCVGGTTILTFQQKTGRRTRVLVEAPGDVSIVKMAPARLETDDAVAVVVVQKPATTT